MGKSNWFRFLIKSVGISIGGRAGVAIIERIGGKGVESFVPAKKLARLSCIEMVLKGPYLASLVSDLSFKSRIVRRGSGFEYRWEIV